MSEKHYINRQNEAAQAAFWNEKAKPCAYYQRRSPYAEEFLLRSGIAPGDTVFDMGCGSGTLCLPLADDGHQVFCGDFSEKMLASVQDVIDEERITNITLRKLSFLDDWTDVPVCDLVFASRSLIDVDPRIVLPKLSAHARKRVCITLHVDLNDGEISGFHYRGTDTISYFRSCINVIIDMGYLPRVEYMSHMFDGRKGWAFIAWDVK